MNQTLLQRLSALQQELVILGVEAQDAVIEGEEEFVERCLWDAQQALDAVAARVEVATREEEPWDGFNSDAEADADVLRNAGMGLDEEYGYFGDEY